MIKIVLVEDDTNFRNNLIKTIKKASDFRCDHSFGDALTFIKFLENGGDVDILLLDLGLPGMSGLEALEPILRLREDLKILILTVYADSPSIHFAMRNGARGYLLKSSTEEEIIDHINRISHGHIIFSVEVSRMILKESRANPDKYHLSSREIEVLQLLAKGMSNIKISEKLFICKSTTETHIRHIFEKMKVENRSEAVAKALKEGLIE